MGGRSAVIRDNAFPTRQALYGAVDNSEEFGGVLRLASLCQSAARVFDAEPCGIAILFLRSLGLTDFEEESFHDELFDTTAQPGLAFGLQIEMKMLRLDHPNSSGLLHGFSLGGLAMG